MRQANDAMYAIHYEKVDSARRKNFESRIQGIMGHVQDNLAWVFLSVMCNAIVKVTESDWDVAVPCWTRRDCRTPKTKAKVCSQRTWTSPR